MRRRPGRARSERRGSQALRTGWTSRRRVREIGIRMALGAQRRDVVSLVLRSGAAPVVAGTIVGMGLVLIVSSAMRSIVLGINPRDPMMLTVVPLSLLAASLIAIWIPARRAATRDPLSALRQD
jgi:ABC-type antimicrobial peptide transport system permease subunit